MVRDACKVMSLLLILGVTWGMFTSEALGASKFKSKVEAGKPIDAAPGETKVLQIRLHKIVKGKYQAHMGALEVFQLQPDRSWQRLGTVSTTNTVGNAGVALYSFKVPAGKRRGDVILKFVFKGDAKCLGNSDEKIIHVR